MESILIKDRKAQQAFNIASIGVIAITLVVAAVILGLGGTILESIQGGQTDNSRGISNNESWTWPGNNTLQSFVQDRVQTNTVVVWGNTTLMGLNVNYSVSAAGVRILNQTSAASSEVFDLLVFNMTYNYNYGSDAYNGSNFGMTGLSTMSEFIPTIAIVAVAAIVIGILLVFFGRKKEGEQ